jgi:Protein of unknown function (DUF4232)
MRGDNGCGEITGWAQGSRAAWRRSALTAVVAVVVLGACSHGSSHASSPTSAATNGSSTTSTTVPETTSSTQPAPTTTPPTVPAPSTTPATVTPTRSGCRSANLTLASGTEQGAAGTQYFQIVFRNHASFACTLIGYPGVSFLDASGRQIGLPAQRTGITQSTVTITPAGSAYAVVGVGNPGVVNCTGVTPHRIRVYPPNETVPVLIAPPSGLLVCATGGGSSVQPVTSHPIG